MLSTETEIFRRCQASLRLLKEQNKYPTREDIPAIVENVFKEVQNNPIFKKEHFKFIKKEDVIERLQQNITTKINTTRILESRATGHLEWLQNTDQSSWLFSKRFYQYLSEKPEFGDIFTDKIFKAADDILARLEDPNRSGEWRRQGLIFGNVQSGKTTSYCALINKAVDAGYKIIIVLGGLNNNLRAQTQIALEENFTGKKTASSRDSTIGLTDLGEVNIEGNFKVNVVTNRDVKKGDFKKSDFDAIKDIGLSDSPILFVVKKNVSTLKNLLSYFQIKISEGKDQIEEPLLIIDDECDHGSINTNDIDKNTDPTRLNGLIRALLAHFKKCSYIAYTATPFANIFINPEDSQLSFTVDGEIAKDKDGNIVWEEKNLRKIKKREKIIKTAKDNDLFPRDFVINLPLSDNYIGAKKIFNLPDDIDENFDSNALPIVRTFEDFLKYDEHMIKLEKEWIPSPHKKDTIFRYNGDENEISPTLKYAIKSFLISIAVRNIRIGSNKHNTMLINITNYNNTQKQVIKNVSEELQYLIEGLSGNYLSLLNEFEKIWKEDFVKTSNSLNEMIKSKAININEPNGFKILSWEEIKKELVIAATKKIYVHGVYGDNRDVLQYEEEYKNVGLNVIAVGAIKLSRGLVLRDLTVSYFKRPAKQYDTLLQMGRWFGYRPRYLDVCRLFLDDELLTWFENAAIASEKLKEDFKDMIDAGKSPSDWGLYVKVFAETKIQTPTARNKMKTSAEYNLSGMEATRPTTTKFDLTPQALDNNLKIFEELISNSEPLKENSKFSKKSNNILFKNIDTKKVLKFLKNYKSPKNERNLIQTLLIKFIEESLKKDKLTSWDLFIKGKEDLEKNRFIKISNTEVPTIIRNAFTGKSYFNVLIPGKHYKANEKGKIIDWIPENILNEKNDSIRKIFYTANISDPNDLEKLIDNDEWDIALKDTIENAQENDSPKIPTKPSEASIRKKIKPTKGYICFYLFNPSKNNHPTFDQLYKDVDNVAVGFVVHLPRTDLKNVKALMNKKAQEELGLIDYDDNFYSIEEDE
jgi:hypothetical protein